MHAAAILGLGNAGSISRLARWLPCNKHQGRCRLPRLPSKDRPVKTQARESLRIQTSLFHGCPLRDGNESNESNLRPRSQRQYATPICHARPVSSLRISQRSRMLSPSVPTYRDISITRLSPANTRPFPLGSRSRTNTPSRTGLALVSFCHGRVSASTGCVAVTDLLTCWTPKGAQFPTANCWSRWTKSSGEGSARTRTVSNDEDGWTMETFTAPRDGNIRTGQWRDRIVLEICLNHANTTGAGGVAGSMCSEFAFDLYFHSNSLFTQVAERASRA